MQLLRQSPQRRPRNRGHWPLKMMLDISPVLGEKSAFSQPTTRTVLPRLLYSLWDIPFAMFVYAMLQLITILSKPISFVFFFYSRFTPNTTVRVL
jgi:hypothetical protein